MKSGTSAIDGMADGVRTDARAAVTLAMPLESGPASALWID
jgi:hypothetical protein